MASGLPDGLEPKLWFSNPVGDVLRVDVPLQNAFPTWLTLRDEVAQTGRWPIMVGGAKSRAMLHEERFDPLNTKENLESARALDAHQILRERFDDAVSLEEEDEDDAYDLDFDLSSLEGVNEDQEWVSTFESEENITLALLPSLNGWEAPSHFGYGNWNDYPPVAEHVAILRHWQDAYGAELMVLTSDVVELSLPEPVRDPEVAKQAAIEWFAYSPDNVDQGVGSIRDLANALMGAWVWSSWWD